MATAKRSRLEDTLTRHQVLVQRLAAGHFAGIDPVLRTLRKEIAARLSVEDPLTEFRRARLERLLAAVDKAVGSPLNAFGRGLLRDLREFGEYEAGFSARALNDAAAGFEAVIPAPAQVRAALVATPLGAGRGGKLLTEFVKDWSIAERNAVTGAIRLGVFQGETNLQIVRRIIGTAANKFADGLVATTRRNAATIVNTAVQHVSTVARGLTFDANADVIKAERWISTLDSRTCVACASLDRQVFARKKGPRPPLHPNCFPAGTLVTTRHKVTGAVKRRFDGQLIVIRTAFGNELTCTPNHPVLTTRGWVAAGRLEVGDDVVRDRGDARSWFNNDHQHVPARIEEVAEAFLGSGEVSAVPVPVSAKDFHGDGMQGDVAVIGANGHLRSGLITPADEFLADSSLVGGDMRLTRLPGSGARGKLGLRRNPSPDGLMSRIGKALSLCRRCAAHASDLLSLPVPKLNSGFSEYAMDGLPAHAEVFRDATGADAGLEHGNDFSRRDGFVSAGREREASFTESPIDDVSADAELARNIINGAYGPVEADRIVSREVRDFSGHVYNLETESGFYAASGIVTHNCRCTMIAVLTDEFAGLQQGGTRASAGASGGRQVPAGLTYFEWLKQQSPGFQDIALGPTRAKLLREGGLSASRFAQMLLDKRFQAMTLEQMRRLEPLAFQRAGM